MKGARKTTTDELNQYNFVPITTSALRLEVKLQVGFSGGVYEWIVPRIENTDG